MTFLTLALGFGPPQHDCLADNHTARKHHGRSPSTFLHGVTQPLLASKANENKLNVSVFRLRHDGGFARVQLRDYPIPPTFGYALTVRFLTASPDGRFLFAECDNTADGRYAPLFLQYRILPDGQLKPYDRVAIVPGSTHLVFHPSGRYAYLSCADQSSAQTQPGRVVQVRVTPEGDLLYPPVASIPCGPMPTALTLDRQGRVGAVLDAETGFLWQYTLTAQGRLSPCSPPQVAVAKDFVAPLMTWEGQSAYVSSQGRHQRYRIYQLRRRAGGGFSLLMPWAVRVPDVIYSMTISNRHRAIYVSSGVRLSSFQVGPQGALRPTSFTLKTGVSVNMAVDEESDLLYASGLNNTLRVYRIHGSGLLTALHASPARACSWMDSLTIVRR